MSKSCSRKINKTRYDDLGKPMKPTSFTVKNLGGKLPNKQFTIVKRSFKSNTKHLSLDSIIPVDELTAENFYRFRTSKHFNIWTPPFFLHGSQYVTNSPTWKRLLTAKFFTSSTMEIKKHLVQNPKAQRRSSFFRENKASVTFCICSMWRPLK